MAVSGGLEFNAVLGFPITAGAIEILERKPDGVRDQVASGARRIRVVDIQSQARGRHVAGLLER